MLKNKWKKRKIQMMRYECVCKRVGEKEENSTMKCFEVFLDESGGCGQKYKLKEKNTKKMNKTKCWRRMTLASQSGVGVFLNVNAFLLKKRYFTMRAAKAAPVRAEQ